MSLPRGYRLVHSANIYLSLKSRHIHVAHLLLLYGLFTDSSTAAGNTYHVKFSNTYKPSQGMITCLLS